MSDVFQYNAFSYTLIPYMLHSHIDYIPICTNSIYAAFPYTLHSHIANQSVFQNSVGQNTLSFWGSTNQIFISVPMHQFHA